TKRRPLRRPLALRRLWPTNRMDLMKQCDTLLSGGIVITMDDDRRVIDDGAVAITDNRIVAVGTQAELADWQANRVIDCSGQVVIPGLIDSHNHLFQLAGRGLGDGMA